MEFITKVENHKIIDFTIFNFNYTFLFDNYIMLDKDNFDPHPYQKSENNFHFQSFRLGDEQNKSYTQLRLRIFHPHGFQHTPRSILFGFDNPSQVIKDYEDDLYTNSEVQEYVKYFLKPYWAENTQKYKKFLDETELYIVFGHSIGESDKYWWENIANNLVKEKAELIIYNFSESDTEEEKKRVAQNFLSVSGVIGKEDTDEVLKRIFVVNFNSKKPRYAFNVDSDNIPNKNKLL